MIAIFVRGVLDKSSFPIEDRPFVIMAGRSNSGKSSLINALTRTKNLARVSKTPGRTTELNFFDIDERYFLVDLPGYGYAARPHEQKSRWSDVITDLFMDARTCLVILLLDIRRTLDERDEMLMEMSNHHEKQVQIVLTKRDKIGRNEFSKIRSEWLVGATGRVAPIVAPLITSVKTGEGLEALKAVIERAIRKD